MTVIYSEYIQLNLLQHYTEYKKNAKRKYNIQTTSIDEQTSTIWISPFTNKNLSHKLSQSAWVCQHHAIVHHA